ncbi:MAG: hypothetical protein WCX29_03365, partial [Candidatus Peribacteraceae bacterium]
TGGSEQVVALRRHRVRYEAGIDVVQGVARRRGGGWRREGGGEVARLQTAAHHHCPDEECAK